MKYLVLQLADDASSREIESLHDRIVDVTTKDLVPKISIAEDHDFPRLKYLSEL